jgi:arylamine N-acetyltransferase
MARHIFTKDQLDQYFTRLSIPPPKRIYDVRSLSDTNKLTFLSLLQKHQLCKVPWENIAQHYSFHHVINIRPNHLFRKIVHNPGVGGYCFEANFFFHLILWNLGVDCYMAGSRIWRAEKGRYGGWTHTVNIVTIAGTKYLLDGGVGPQGPHIPVPLKPGVLLSQVEPAQMQLD